MGLKIDNGGLLYVAGNTGVARVHQARGGEVLRSYQLSEATGHFINDVTLLGDRAWWLPRRLERVLPDLDIEGEKLNRRLARGADEDAPVPV